MTTRCRRPGPCHVPTPCAWRTERGLCGAMDDRLTFVGGFPCLNGRFLQEGTLLRVYFPIGPEEIYGRLARREDGAWVLEAGERMIRLLGGLKAKEV